MDTSPSLSTVQSIHAPLGLNIQALLVEVGQQAVVGLVEDVACQRCQACEDVSGAACVLAARHPGAELACRASWRCLRRTLLKM